MRICPYCNKPVSDDELKVCPHCYANIENVNIDPQKKEEK